MDDAVRGSVPSYVLVLIACAARSPTQGVIMLFFPDAGPRMLRTTTAVLLVTLVSAPISIASAQHSESEVPELVPPLPTDPAERAAALERVQRAAAKRTAQYWSGAWTAPAPARVQGRRAPTTGVRRSTVAPMPGSTPFEVPRPGRVTGVTPPQPGSDAGLVVVNDPPASPMAAGHSFDAVDDTGWKPASPDIAAGPSHVVVVTNNVFAVFDKCGNWVDGGAFLDYFGLTTDAVVYDPRIVYDEWNNRWVMTWSAYDIGGQEAWVYIVVSRTGDPAAGWKPALIFAESSTGFPDASYLAVDPETIYVSFDQFLFTGPLTGMFLYILDKEQVYDHNSPTGFAFAGYTNPGDGSLAQSIRPAQMRAYPGEMFLVNDKPQGGSIATLWRVAGAPSAPSLNKANIALSPYSSPPNMLQPGGTYIDALDARYTDAVYVPGRLIAARSSLRSYTADHASLFFDEFNPVIPQLVQTTLIYNSSTDRAYPAFDIDEYGNIGIVMAESNSSIFPSATFRMYDSSDWSFNFYDGLAIGEASYTAGSGGTSSNPYRWGNYFGAATDPVDDRTIWVVGTYASNDPAPSWATRVGCYSAFPTWDLDVSPDDVLTLGMTEGGTGPLQEYTYRLTNPGQMAANWQVSYVPIWLTPSMVSGEIPPGGTQDVTFVVNHWATDLTTGLYTADLLFENCSGPEGGVIRSIELGVVAPLLCDGGTIDPRPEGIDDESVYGPAELGVFVTAMEDIDMCALAARVTGDYYTMSMRIYEADGTTRGALVAESSGWNYSRIPGGFRSVPFDVTLHACQDYELVFDLADGRACFCFDEALFDEPFDVGGAIRVRKGTESGSTATTRLPEIVIMGAPACGRPTDAITDLFPSGAPAPEEGSDQQTGLFITALDNVDLCSVGFEADLNRDETISAVLYPATGEARDFGPALAYGSATVTETGMRVHRIPIVGHLERGEEYDISLTYHGPGYWQIINEVDAELPDTVGNTVVVRRGEHNGAASTLIPHLDLGWKHSGTGGVGFDLGAAWPPFTVTGPLDHGAFVTALATQQVYGVGVMADIPEGAILFARVYKADQISDNRLLLLSEGSVYTSGTGMRWHDVPVALEWLVNKKYDISVVCTLPAGYEYWDDSSGLPYTAYGAITVRNGENGGWAGSTDLVHLRVHACDAVLTGVDEKPPALSSMFIRPAVPNPSGDRVRFEYSLDAPATADLEIFDALGRRVATVFSGRALPAGVSSERFDTSTLRSGVYFVKLSTAAKGVSRKFVVTR